MSAYTIEALSAQHHTIPRTTTIEETEEEFPYGWRRVVTKPLNGEETYIDIPLTIEDILDPQEEDQMPQRPVHAQCSIDIFDMLQNRYRDNETIGVYYDCKMIWGIPGLLRPAPDVAVIPNVKDKTANITSFEVKKEGTRPYLVIEIVSPTYPGDDTKKVKIYERAGVEEYIIINPHSERDIPFYEIQGYQLKNGKYQPIAPDRWGRLFSQTTDVLFGVYQKGRRLRLKDATTGNWLLTAQETDIARIDAEAQAEIETKARIAAEIRVQAEVKARIDAEIQAQAEAKARIDMEIQLQALKKRLKELETKQK
jgi:colicin import membrane protein